MIGRPVPASVAATVVSGHRVASGLGGDPRFPQGTITPQLPFFRRAMPDMVAFLGGEPFPGTINLKVDGRVEVRCPEFRLPDVRWTDAFPPETFYLSRAALQADDAAHPVLLYIPDPATKPDHFQPADRIELLASRIEGVAYGAAVRLLYDPDAILIRPAG